MTPEAEPPRDRYPWLVLFVLTLVYVLNFVDRQIPSILAERIKGDLGSSDAQMGFLYGTAFAVFYAVFGIPLGRLADAWVRTRLIALGLAVWSLMTAVSGLAGSFTALALARVGVGVGEASASPAAYPLLADWFPEKRRATVLAIYQSGIHIGSGIGLGIGGLIVNRWDAAWAAESAPFGLRGWQVAFFVVGLPGLLLALVVGALREPVRGQSDGIVTAPEPHPFRAFGRELRAVVPPFGLLHLWLERAGGAALALNLAAAGSITALAWLCTAWLGTAVQWICLGIGLYAAVSWAQALQLRDRVAFALLFRTPSLKWAALAFAALASVQYGLGFWMAPFFIRLRHVPEAEAGLMLGGIHALGGWIGVTLGGFLGDRWRRSRPAGRIQVTMLTATLPIPLALVVLTTPSTTLAYALYFPQSILAALWAGPAVATIQDLVLPRMRGIASAAYLLLVTIVGLAIGPYMIGRLSGAFGDLRLAMICGLGANLAALACALVAARHFAADETSRLARARAAGEPGL